MEERERRIISGKGRFVDDIDLPNMAHCVFVGSPCASAKIKHIDVQGILKIPGVLTVITGKDLAAVTEPLPDTSDFKSRGWHWRTPKVYALAVDRVTFQGEPVAAVVAESPRIAGKAAGLLKVEYDLLEPVTDTLQAMQKDAALVYEEWGDNIQLHLTYARGEVEAAFGEADRIIDISWREGRASGFPIESRGCVASYDLQSQRLATWGSYQCPFRSQHYIAHVLRMPQSCVQVQALDIGGAFGNKVNCWKHTVVCLASRMTGRPVKWFERSREMFLSGPHQRDVIWEGKVAVKNNGQILGITAKFIQDFGVDIANRGYAAPTMLAACSAVPNAYHMKGLKIELYGVVTNKSFFCAYRGFGKDKGAKFMERVIDAVSNECQISPEALRFINFIQPHEMPCKQLTGSVYDSGDYPAMLQAALKLSEVDKWRRKQTKLRKQNRYIGIGMAFTIEPAGVAVENARYSGMTQAHIRITSDGLVEVDSDRTEIGQGAEASNAMVVSDILGMKLEDIVIKPVSSNMIGIGPVSSRGSVYCLSAIARAAKEIRRKIVRYASLAFGVKPEDIDMKEGIIFSKSDPKKRLLHKELVDRMYFRPGPRGLPKAMQLDSDILLDVSATWFSPNTAMNPTTTYTTFSAGADVVIVEVDIETGKTTILNYVHVHDAGKIISKKHVDGQIRGGIIQGIGEALSEELVYNRKGELLNSSYVDFIMQTAMDAPHIIIKHFESPSPFTELGTKGMGESPIIGSKVAVISAIENALSSFNIRITQAPATGERVRKLILEARSS